MLSSYKEAEKCSYRSTKRLICLKQKDWSKRGVPVTSTRCLNSQFLTTATTIPHGSKNSSAEYIHDVWTCLILTNTVTHIEKHTHSRTDSFTHTHTHTHTHTPTGAWIKKVNTFDWGIFGAVWKGRGGGQKFFAEVIKAPGSGSWYAAIRSIFLI